MTTKFRLLRSDGRTYLSRRGFECRWFGVYLHNIGTEDPSRYLHDHPWWFRSLVIRGEYVELIAPSSDPDARVMRHRRIFSFAGVDLNQCHTIIGTTRSTWTIVFRGRRYRSWGFYTPDGWVYWEDMPRIERDLTFKEIS
jgi:hypothetical protein